MEGLRREMRNFLSSPIFNNTLYVCLATSFQELVHHKLDLEKMKRVKKKK